MRLSLSSLVNEPHCLYFQSPEPDPSCGPAGSARPAPGLTSHGGGPGLSFLHPPSPTGRSLSARGPYTHRPRSSLSNLHFGEVTAPPRSLEPVCVLPSDPPGLAATRLPGLPASPLSPPALPQVAALTGHPAEDSKALRSPTPPPALQLSLSDQGHLSCSWVISVAGMPAPRGWGPSSLCSLATPERPAHSGCLVSLYLVAAMQGRKT